MKTRYYRIFKNLSSALGCVFLLSSCSEVDLPSSGKSDGENVISFRSFLQDDLSSRGTLLTDEGFNKFYVTSFLGSHTERQLYFENVPFTYTDNAADGAKLYTSQQKYVCPATNLEFFAYSPSLEELNSPNASIENSDKGYKITNFHIPKNISEHLDLVTAHTEVKYSDVLKDRDTDITEVPLEFNHQLCQVSVQAIGKNINYDYEIAGIRIGNPAVDGTFNFNSVVDSCSWESKSLSRVEYIFQRGEKPVVLDSIKPLSIMGNGGPAIVIPTKNGPWSQTYENSDTTSATYSTNEMYFSVLMRVSRNNGIDVAFPYPHKSEYPYNKAHYDSMNLIYFSINRHTNVIENRLYFDENSPLIFG